MLTDDTIGLTLLFFECNINFHKEFPHCTLNFCFNVRFLFSILNFSGLFKARN